MFIPKCRRKTLYKALRPHVGEVFRKVAQQILDGLGDLDILGRGEVVGDGREAGDEVAGGDLDRLGRVQ